MDCSNSEGQFEAETQASKKRKVMEKTVVTVKIEAKEGKRKNEGPPSDNWSWRKYGQKPIKGSPYPRGYYRCSTSKGCSARKQVERCKNDASMLIITYTSTHNHPGPDLPTAKRSQEPQAEPIQDPPATPKRGAGEEKEEQQQQDGDGDENHFRYCQSPFNPSQDIMVSLRENPLAETLESTCVMFDEEPFPRPPLTGPTEIKSEEFDFYDELEELPTYSAFTSFPGRDLFDERILVHPS